MKTVLVSQFEDLVLQALRGTLIRSEANTYDSFGGVCESVAEVTTDDDSFDRFVGFVRESFEQSMIDVGEGPKDGCCNGMDAAPSQCCGPDPYPAFCNDHHKHAGKTISVPHPGCDRFLVQDPTPEPRFVAKPVWWEIARLPEDDCRADCTAHSTPDCDQHYHNLLAVYDDAILAYRK